MANDASVSLKNATLSRAADGLFLDDKNGRTLVDVEALRLSERVLGDELTYKGEVYAIPRGRGGDVQSLIAAARLGPQRRGQALAKGRYCTDFTTLHANALGTILAKDEVALAWLATNTSVAVSSSILESQSTQYLLISDRRNLLVAVANVGDLSVTELGPCVLHIEKKVGRDRATLGDSTFDIPLLSEKLFGDVAHLCEIDGAAQRHREFARLHLGHDDELVTMALERARDLGDAESEMLAWALHDHLPFSGSRSVSSMERALSRMAEQHESSTSIVFVARDFGLDIATCQDLLEHLCSADKLAWALPLHTWIRERILDDSDDDAEHTAADIRYAQHLLRTAAYEEAEVVLQARLNALPSEELADLLPSTDEDLVGSDGGQKVRSLLLTMLSTARGRGKQDAKTLVELAQLAPLAKDRVLQMYDAVGDPLRERARQVLAVQDKGGLAPLDDDVPLRPDGELHRLPKELLHQTLRHPAAREGHALGKLQAFLADAKAPNHSSLKDYCERLSERTSPVASAALADASLVLGVPSVTGFVSRGDRAVGIRAYEDKTPFLLIGGRHLEKDSEFYLHPWELRFAVAAEVAHLRFKHTRVTASDVWAGTFEKGRFGVELLLSAVPLMRGIDLIDKVGKIIDRYQDSVFGKLTKGIDLTEKTLQKVRGEKPTAGRRREKPIAAGNRDLVAAHRVMQLTSDRAGLLLSGDLGAALRAMFLLIHDYQPELSVAVHHGLAGPLSRTDDDGVYIFQDLAIRVTQLLRFYLSDDYAKLRERLLVGK